MPAISQLPTATFPTGAEYFPVVQDGETRKLTIDTLANGWGWDEDGRYLQSTGSYAGTAGATITRIDQFSTPFVGSIPVDMRLGVGNLYEYAGVGDAYVNYQINSWSKADGNVWSVAVAGTAQALSNDAKAWGIVGVGHAATASASAHAAEFDICVNNTIGGDFNNAYGVGIGAGSSGSGIAGHAKAYMYWAQVGGSNAVQHGLLLRDSSYSPLESDGWIMTTGFNAGQGGSANLACAGLANFLNTALSGNFIQYGSSTFAQAFMGSDGSIGFTGNAALYAITSGGTARRVLDTDPTPSLVRMYGPNGTTIHLQISDTEVFQEATTHNWRTNDGSIELMELDASSLDINRNVVLSNKAGSGGQSGMAVTNIANNFSAFNSFISLSGGSPVTMITGINGNASNLLFSGSAAFNGAIGPSSGVGLEFATSNTVRMVISSSGPTTINNSFKSTHATAGIGYGTGAGGTVTQATSKSTGVTLDKVTGTITMNNATLNAGTSVSFTLTNSAIAATDLIAVSIKSGASADSYTVMVTAVAAGSCVIQLHNFTGGNLSEAVVLSFAVFKGVAA